MQARGIKVGKCQIAHQTALDVVTAVMSVFAMMTMTVAMVITMKTVAMVITMMMTLVVVGKDTSHDNVLASERIAA